MYDREEKDFSFSLRQFDCVFQQSMNINVTYYKDWVKNEEQNPYFIVY